jgi:predicted regulator of Ras-like GTPase activity (Roadblock/LC7/MglB family)
MLLSDPHNAALQSFARPELERLVASNTAIRFAVLTSGDGHEIAARPARSEITARVAAMSSSLQALSDALVREANLGGGRNLIIESDAGVIVIQGLPSAGGASLAVLASGSGILGQVLWAARNCCQSLQEGWAGR